MNWISGIIGVIVLFGGMWLVAKFDDTRMRRADETHLLPDDEPWPYDWHKIELDERWNEFELDHAWEVADLDGWGKKD